MGGGIQENSIVKTIAKLKIPLWSGLNFWWKIMPEYVLLGKTRFERKITTDMVKI